MKNRTRTSLIGLGALGMALAVPGIALASTAQSGTGTATYQADLQPVVLNTPAGAASGSLTLRLSGDQATVTEHVSGLGATLPTSTKTLAALGIPAAFAGKPFPHVQHIHIDGKDTCPTAAADTNHNGVISVAEGEPAYGKIGTTLDTSGSMSPAQATNVTVAPSGGSYSYSRSFTVNQATLSAIKNNDAVIVVHGLNPANAPKASLTTPNSLDLTLQGANKKVAMIATAPALCGRLTSMPAGAPNTGGGATAGVQHEGLFEAGGALLIAGAAVGGVAYIRRRRSHA